MSTNIRCPKPQRLHKHPVADIYSSSTYDQRSESPPHPHRRLSSQSHQVTRSGSAPPWPTCPSGSKHCRPLLPTDSPVDAWLSAVSSPDPRSISPPNDRPSTCPATVDVSKVKDIHLSLAALQHKSQQQSKITESRALGSDASQTRRPDTSNPQYRDIIYYNYITIDIAGQKLP